MKVPWTAPSPFWPCWVFCFIESQPWHTLLEEVQMFPIEDARNSLRESVLLPILCGTAHASASKKSSLQFLLCPALTWCLACILAVCQVCSYPVNTLKTRTLHNSSNCPQYPAQSPIITSFMKSLWNEQLNNRTWFLKKIVIQIEGQSTNQPDSAEMSVS